MATALQPLNHAYLPKLEQNVWPELQDPFYDRGSRYTVPYVVWSDGIGWRNDKLREDVAAMDVPWDIFWQAEPYRGKVGLLDDKRGACRYGATRTGSGSRVSTEIGLVAKVTDLQSSTSATSSPRSPLPDAPEEDVAPPCGEVSQPAPSTPAETSRRLS
jgi:spermidine/putrescine transport system substrate-binding protein